MCKKVIFFMLLSMICDLNAFVQASDVEIVRYDSELKLDVGSNAVHTIVCCKVQNDSPEKLTQLTFDIFAREDRCKARTEVHRILQEVSNNSTPLKFHHGRNGWEESGEKLLYVTLLSPLAPGSSTDIVFDYTWQASDPTNARDNYRPFSTLPNGQKEVCLLSDLAWLPVVQSVVNDNPGAGRFPKRAKPSWAIKVLAPSDFEIVALGGRHVRTEQQNESVVSEWESTVPFYPQLMAGRFEKQVVKAESIQTVLYMPQAYEQKLVRKIGEQLAQAYDLFTELFGPLKGNEIHIGISSAGQGGHGGYLSFIMDTNMLGYQITEERLPFVMEPMRHELAHSWWGWSVSSYGVGTKFLRESLANFSNAWFVERTTGQDRLDADMAKLFWLGLQTDVICGADSDSERAAYLKGHVVLNILRTEMGDEQFFKLLKHFASEYQGGHATMSDFINACRQVTSRDWKIFFDEWCFSAGVPDYGVEKFDSQQRDSTWETRIDVRNFGNASITCPLELWMNDYNDRTTFLVEAGQTKTLIFTTPNRVTKVVIDPDHRTFQGIGRECRLKMLGVGKVDMEWIWYWRAVVLAEEGQYDRAIEEITRAIGQHTHPAYSYSRGIAYLKKGDIQAARSDFIDFLDWISKSDNPQRSLVYPGLLSSNSNKQQEQLNQILRLLTDQNLPTHEQWQKWWKANRESFQPGQSALQLGPGGLQD